MELVLIKPNSTEWDYMWQWLENHPINEGISEPSVATNDNESWQYMGSYKQGERVLHTFRHRNHPTTNYIKTVSVKASETLTPDQIEKTFRL